MRSVVATIGALLVLGSAARVDAQQAAPIEVPIGDEGAHLDPPSGESDAEEIVLEDAHLLDQRFGQARDGVGARLHAWGSLALGTGTYHSDAMATRAQGDSTVIAPSLGLRFAVSEDIDAQMEWTVAYGIVHVVGAFDDGMMDVPFDERLERVEATNPTLSFAWSHAWSSLRLQIGLGASIPAAALAQSPTDARTAAERAASLSVHQTLLGMHAAIDPWRFFPERLSFSLPVRIAFGDRIGGAVEVAGGWTIPVLGGTGDHEGVLQAAGDVVVEAIPELRFGVRGAIVAWQIGSDTVRTQASLEPWARLAIGPGFATLRGTLPIGGELGIDTRNPTWAIHLGGGAALERE